MQMETDDGAAVYIEMKGISKDDDSGAHTAVRFETGDEKYAWLNYVLAVGVSSLDRPPPPPLNSLIHVFKVRVAHVKP